VARYPWNDIRAASHSPPAGVECAGDHGGHKRDGVLTMIRRWAPRLIVSLPWLVGAAMVWYAWPRAPRDLGPDSIIVTPYPVLVMWGLRVLAAAWCLSLTFLLYHVAVRGDLAWVVIVAYGVTVLLVAIAGFESFAALITGWTDVSHLRASNARTYHVLHRWESDALAEELGQSPLFLRMRIIGVNSNERGYCALVRPSGVRQYDLAAASGPGHPDRGHLAQSRDGRWIVYLSAYQDYPEAKKGCSSRLVYDQSRNICYRDEDLKEASPFLLIGPSDRLNTGDLDALLYARETGQEWVQADTDIHALSRETKSQNREVRVAVARVLAETRSWDPDLALALSLTERMFRDDADSEARQAASEAANRLRGLMWRTREDRLH